MNCIVAEIIPLVIKPLYIDFQGMSMLILFIGAYLKILYFAQSHSLFFS